MKKKLKNPVVLKDALYNCSTNCTNNNVAFNGISGLNPSQCYGQGIVNGVVSGLIATGMTFEEALDVVNEIKHDTFDPNCMPVPWREL